MPELTTTTATRGISASGIPNAGALTVTIPRINLPPVQLPGFVPMHDCSLDECRKPNDQTCCDINMVFGNVISGKGGLSTAVTTSTYENDWNTFGIDMALYSSNPSAANVTWYLQQCSGSNVWTNKATLNNNSYGKYYAVNSIADHKTYSIYSLNWGRVLKVFGSGIYRIKVLSSMRSLSGCLISDSFFLRQFNCAIADGSVKIEITNTGKIGSHADNGKLFDLCGITYFDSFRFGGTFGKRKTPEYLQKINQFQTGKQNLYSDKAITKYELAVKLLPKEYHDRLSVYMMMAGTRLVSDYNISNPDYGIKQFSIMKDGGYEPDYYQKNRNQKVKLVFTAGIQNIIKSLCCSTKRPGAL